MIHLGDNPARDPRIEDPTNRWLMDPAARCLVSAAVRLRISANAVSLSGLVTGGMSALAYGRWQQAWHPTIGLLLSLVWLITDSLDGMVARATGTSSAFGRELDGLCDHAVFTMLYIALACSIGGIAIWLLMVAAAVAHVVQASLYEAERVRFNRRLRGEPTPPPPPPSKNPAIRLYNRLASSLDRTTERFDRRLAAQGDDAGLRQRYAQAAIPAMRLMVPLSQNFRMAAVFLACLCGRMTVFLWLELIPCSILLVVGILRLRAAERALSA